MDKASNQERSVNVRVKGDASNRMMRSKVAVELHLLPHVRITMLEIHIYALLFTLLNCNNNLDY